MNLEKRIELLEKRVAELEGPKNKDHHITQIPKADFKKPYQKIDNTTKDLSDVLTAKELAPFLGLSERRVYELMDISEEVGGIPCLRIGRSKRVLKTDLIEWLEKQKRDVV